MFSRIKQRLAELEARIYKQLPFWPGDEDGFTRALGVDLERFKVKNPDGSVGFDEIAALSATAAKDWADEIDTTNPTP